MEVTVVICTHNGAARLPAVFERLRAQQGVESLAWELIVVDNNSTDSTPVLVRQHQQSWPLLRLETEPQQGLAHARRRGVLAARGQWVAFLDDDNLPHPDWLLSLVQWAAAAPRAGAVGGRIHPLLDTAPPPYLHRAAPYLALQDFGPAPCRLQPERLRLPAGAGLAVRRAAWLQSVPARQALVGRVHGHSLAGEDYESLLHLHHHGWEIWFNPALQIDHAIPAHRLAAPYLRQIAHGCGLPMAHLWVLAANGKHVPWILTKTFLGNLRQLLQHLPGRNADPAAQADFAFYRAATLSPFFYLRNSQ